MSVYKSAMGKAVNMESLRVKNENVRAVGNMNVNARGDIIDSTGKVINDASQRVNKMYNKTTTNRGALATSTNPSPLVADETPLVAPPPSDLKADEPEVLTAEEQELMDDDFVRDDAEIETDSRYIKKK